MPGRLRTASSPSRTVIALASYAFAFSFFGAWVGTKRPFLAVRGAGGLGFKPVIAKPRQF